MTGNVLRNRVRDPCCLAAAVALTTNLLGMLLLAVIFPLANDGSTVNRLAVRIVGFTVAVEAMALIMRACTHQTVYSQFPTDRLLMLQIGIMLVPAILGRLIATQMPTRLGTAILSLGLLVLELGMRYTLVKRDIVCDSVTHRCSCFRSCFTCVRGKGAMGISVSVEMTVVCPSKTLLTGQFGRRATAKNRGLPSACGLHTWLLVSSHAALKSSLCGVFVTLWV
jgi:hypothetical protein